MDYRDRLKKFLKDQEGYSDSTYEDSNGNVTAGYGANMSHPGTKELMESRGLSSIDTHEDAEKLMDAHIDEKNDLINKSISNFSSLPDNQQQALLSLMYNNPKLIGPILKSKVESGNTEDAAKEILLNSNKNKQGGIAKRRIEEAALFGGGKLPALNMEEEANLKGAVSNISNDSERAKVFKRLEDLLNRK